MYYSHLFSLFKLFGHNGDDIAVALMDYKLIFRPIMCHYFSTSYFKMSSLLVWGINSYYIMAE